MEYNPERNRLVRFDSPEALYDALAKMPTRHQHTGDGSWAGKPYADALRLLDKGDLTWVERASKLIENIEQAAVFTSGVKLMMPSVAGYIPNVPALVSGHPESMLMRQESELQGMQTPIGIYYDTGVSAGVSDTQLLNRGVACLALVMALQMFRPVELYVVHTIRPDNGIDCAGYAVKVETKPLDLARACYMLTSNEMARRLSFSTCYLAANCTTYDFSGQWAWSMPPSLNNKYIEYTRRLFDMTPDDILLDGAFLFDKLCLTDPLAWVKKMVARHAGVEFD